MDKKDIAVGDSTRLEIIFSTKKYDKRMVKSPRIQTNEGPPDKRVQIITSVVARPDSTYPVVISPYKIDLSQFGDKVRDEMKFAITNNSDAKLDLTMISTFDEYFEVDLPKSISAGETKEAVLKLKQEAVTENFEKSFTFELNDEAKSRFTVPVKRTLRSQGEQTIVEEPGH